MIGKTNVKGGKVTISIYGAASETVTYSGKESGSVKLAADGVGTVTLKIGNYTFSAGISGRTVTTKVKKGTTVVLRPANFIYWYGVEAVKFGGINGNDWYQTVTRNTNNITFSVSRNNNGSAYRSFMTSSAVDMTNYSSLKGILEGMAVNGWYRFGATTSVTDYEPSSGAVIAVNKPSVNTVNLSGITGNRYIGVMGTSYAKSGEVVGKIHAIWME